MDFKFKNDQYRLARGKKSKLINLYCRVCKKFIMVYQKDDYPGRLRRLYFDRILFPSKLAKFQTIPINKVLALKCSYCKEDLATPYIYKKENRNAFKVYQDAFIKKPRNLKE